MITQILSEIQKTKNGKCYDKDYFLQKKLYFDTDMQKTKIIIK